MAYTPVNWQTGDTITADRLNRMDRGWDISTTELFSETVTTTGGGPYEGQFAYTGDLTAGTITVTYDGTEYVCPSIGAGEYGAPYSDGSPNFSVYPFNLFKDGDTVYLTTQTAGEHTVAAVIPSLETSSDFDAARGYGYKDTSLFSETVTTADDGSGTNVTTLVYANMVDANTITVVFDGTEYVCPSIGAGKYGAPYSDGNPDFSVYPFAFQSMLNPIMGAVVNTLYTQTAGEHTVAVTAPVMKSGTDFAAAVQSVVDDAIASVPTPLLVTIGTTTWVEVNSALKAGRSAFVWGHTDFNNRPDYYEFVATALYDSLTVYTLTVSSGAAVVNTYQATSQDGVLTKVTS